MLISMSCWGSWANTMKLCPGYRFQLFYWDYVIGLLFGAILWGFTLGSTGSEGVSFVADLTKVHPYHLGMALLGGVIFNLANLLLVAAIDVAGLAVAFPIGIGLALVIGAISNYFINPAGNPLLLFGGIALVVAAIVMDALAYRLRERERRNAGSKGILLSLLSGVLMGSFYPFVSKAMFTSGASGPYAVAFLFVIGVALCAIPANYLLMRKPIDGQTPVDFSGYVAAPKRWHLWGAIGGMVWCTGAVFNFVAARTHFVGPAVSYSIGQGATMVSAGWGVFVWREFAGTTSRIKLLLTFMFIFFLLGLCAIAAAPLFAGH
ncbi:GRP family sugar transporter [Tunturiibacter gelidoferens]|uniref:GRP family sugar transporter n=1 Tax=Tunturiibacter gelidiferens TaxID=3069689 RepID=UPI001C8459A8|nr:GRP family sugar transporter [Edaphobacter lichenicola]